MFRCPKCHKPLIREGMSYICENRHCYDCAKSGYVNLTLSHKKLSGDDMMMVKARSDFLVKGYYEPLQQVVTAALRPFSLPVLIDAGCGQGYYTNALAKELPDTVIYGFDLSKYALKTAAKANHEVHYAAASIAQIPLADECAAGIVSIFAPVYEQEFRRLLKTGGIVLRVGPGPRHLWELKQLLYDDVYENMPADPLTGFHRIRQTMVDYMITIDNQADIQALFAMTPYVYRTAPEKAAQLKEISHLSLQLQFNLELWQK